jgi:predicted kinase
LEIDALRRNIANYREQAKVSGKLSYDISAAIVEVCFSAGLDVIIDKAISDTDVMDRFFQVAKKYNANTYEFILNASKELVIKRAENRVYRVGGLLTFEKMGRWWEDTQEYIKKRPQAIVVDTETLSQEEVYKYITDKL